MLIGALSSTRGTVEDFEKKVATWFDTTQDRLTGEYARQQRWITLAVGSVLVIFLNADAIRLSRELQANDSLRSSMVDEAQALFQAGVESACAGKTDGDEHEACIIDETRGLLVRLEPALVGWGGDPALTTAQGLLASAQGLFVSDATAAQAVEQAPAQEAAANPVGVILHKLLGLMITVMAVSLGAPFWFDMLNKVVTIRGAGIKPEKTAPQV